MQTVDEQYYPYARPQESGNHTEVRWVTFSNAKGRKIQFAFTDSLLSFSALPYNLDDLDPELNKKQYHSGELNKRNETYLHIDLNQTGLQGMDSWGAWITVLQQELYVRGQSLIVVKGHIRTQRLKF